MWNCTNHRKSPCWPYVPSLITRNREPNLYNFPFCPCREQPSGLHLLVNPPRVAYILIMTCCIAVKLRATQTPYSRLFLRKSRHVRSLLRGSARRPRDGCPRWGLRMAHFFVPQKETTEFHPLDGLDDGFERNIDCYGCDQNGAFRHIRNKQLKS